MTDRDWFEVRRFPHGISMIREPHHSEDVKSYLVEGERDVAVIDTGTGAGDFAALVTELSARRPLLLQTHAHWDHIGASHRFTEARVHVSEAEALRTGVAPDRYHHVFWRDPFDRSRVPAGLDTSAGIPGREPTGWLDDGDRIDLGGRTLEVLHTPGHSPGGVSFLDREARALFCGDLLYFGKMYVFFADSDAAAFRRSLQRVASLTEIFDDVFPSHGDSPLTAHDVLEIRDAFEQVWSGRAASNPGALYGYDVTVFNFDQFSFLLSGESSR